MGMINVKGLGQVRIAGDVPTEQERQNMLKAIGGQPAPETPQDYAGIPEALRAGVQGLTFGLGEEIAGLGAGLGAGTAALIEDQPVMETVQQAYGQEVAERRAKQD